MESHAQSAENVLLEGFSFKLPATAEYVVNRRSVTFMPQGGNQYAPTGVRVIKINLTGSDWLDPSTVRFQFNINNMDTTALHQLRILGGPWSFFRRLRVLCGGTIIEDIDYYAKAHEMFHILTNPHARMNDAVEGCGEMYDIIRNQISTDDGPVYNTNNFTGIAPGDFRTVFFKPLAGILNQSKFLPIRYCPLQFEFELISSMTDVIVFPRKQNAGANQVDQNDVPDPTNVGSGLLFQHVTVVDTSFVQATCSQQWQLTNVQLKCDLVTLDNGLQDEYAKHLLGGKPLPVNFSTFITQKQIVNGPDYSTSVTRSLSRLKSVFLTFSGGAFGDPTSNALPVSGLEMRKWWNDFYHPGFAHNVLLSGDEVEIQLQIGSKYFPEYPIKSQAEAMYQLRKTLGITGSSWHGIDIRPDDYKNCKFIVGIDTEKMLDAGFTGLNTKAGDLMTIRLKQPGVPANALINMLHITLHSDCVMEIRDSGVQVMD